MNTHPICNSPLYRSAQRSFAPLQKLRRKEITVCTSVNRSPILYGFRASAKAIRC